MRAVNSLEMMQELTELLQRTCKKQAEYLAQANEAKSQDDKDQWIARFRMALLQADHIGIAQDALSNGTSFVPHWESSSENSDLLGVQVMCSGGKALSDLVGSEVADSYVFDFYPDET